MELGSGSSALGALRAFATSCCPQSERKTGGGCCADALALAMSPPPASDEFAHEVAATFVFADEMKTVRQLQSKCKEGRELVNVIYCSRSCARAFPPGVVADEAAPNKMKQYHHAIFAVLQPQMEKIKQLNEYCAQAVVLLSDNIQRTTVHENMTRVIPDVMMDALVDIMDVILQLNHLHDSKSSLRNDFSVFKRVFLHIKDDLPDAETIEKDIARLQEFMGSSYQAKGAVWDSLRHNLTNVKRYEQVTYLLLRHCVNHIENDTCTTPSSRFKYIRALSYLMAVLEGSDVWKKTNTLPGADKKVIEAAVKLIARFPVIPMLLEASIKPVKALQSQSSYRLESSNGASSSKNRDAMFDIVAASRECKSTCETFLPRLMHTLNSTTNREHTQEQNDTLYEVLVDGIAHLCKWKSNFLLFMAWKYQNPKTSEKLREAGIPMDSPLLEYERVTKHNYSDEEWQAMADIIYGVKSVVQILRGFQSKLAKCVRRTVYQHIQVFIQHTLLPILHRADKRKLACTKLIHDIRAMNGDWIDSELLVSDFKKKHKERKYSQIPDRTASPSLCQIQMLRTAIDSVYARRSMGDLNAKSSTSSVLFSFKKDLDSSDAETLQEFYHKAGAFPSRVHEQISQTIRTDLCQHFSLKFDNWLFTRMPLHEALMLTVGDQFAHEECLRKAKQHRLSRGSIFRTKLGNSAAVKAAKYGALEKTITGTHRTFFGEPHVQALCKLLPRRELVDVANDCIEFAVTKIEDVLALCIPALGSTIPPFRLPRFMYRTEGCYGYFEGKFKHLLDSDELEAQIFHCFREIGNALMFLLVLGTVLNVSAIQSNATQQSANSTERLPSLFQCALERIDSMLKRSEIAFEWEAGPDSQPEKMPNASSFYHVWCALEFLSCNRPRGGGDYSLDQGESLSLREMFGDGVQLAGCTLVHLLGQRTLYDLWNVSQHVINVRHYEDVKATSEAQVTLVSNSKKSRHKGELPNVQTTVGTLDQEMEDKAARFVVNAREMGATSKQIFHTLELAWPSGPRPAATFTPPQFTPPVNTLSSPLAAQYHR
ncbi:hypothetical protein PF002_g9064 [Phytophthora fragariae]|uniref:CYRIA/CYRIB Rac1 binding domain-containing protein n=1 Tax=Phytophthora fragariae TaxID=53985 RepID=A0A6A3ZU69_9STRA|nr:hypothetical protein PF002_g9064 [Phytophthora fragariae]